MTIMVLFQKNPRNPNTDEKAVGLDELVIAGIGYARVASRYLWFSLYGKIDQLDFPEDSS